MRRQELELAAVTDRKGMKKLMAVGASPPEKRGMALIARASLLMPSAMVQPTATEPPKLVASWAGGMPLSELRFS